jgi:hypothetical protein
MMDEGNFLYKGYLFASGVYRPFQDYGPWVQKGVFSYLIPGVIQLWFGPGLRIGRFFAILVSLLALMGLWLVVLRLGGGWWAAAVVWIISLNPALIKYYSVANSQGLAACLLAWSLFFAVGMDSPAWQLTLSAFLASVLAFVRQDMVIFLPFLFLYLFWQHGWRRSLWAVAACVLVFLLVDLWYWPGILKMWVAGLPAGLLPFLNSWLPPAGRSAAWDVRPSVATQVGTLFLGLRYHFAELFGGFTVLLLWPARTAWKNRGQFRTAVFLGLTFMVLVVMHAWVGTGNTIANNFNAYSFGEYLAFFSFIGLLMVVLLAFSWSNPVPGWRQWLAILGILVLGAGMGYSGTGTFGFWIVNMRIPQLQGGHFLPGTARLGTTFSNTFHLSSGTSLWFLSALAGLGIVLLALLLTLALWLVLRALRSHQARAMAISFGALALIVVLVAGILLSPTQLLGGDYRDYDCSLNVIDMIENSGHELASHIPPGSTVYWDGGSDVAVLLYLPGIHIFPSQLDENYSYWLGGNSDALARYGFWNDSLMQQYLQHADYFIIQERNLNSNWVTFLAPSTMKEIQLSSQKRVCRPGDNLLLFHRE